MAATKKPRNGNERPSANIFATFGAPRILHSDNGKEFANKLVNELPQAGINGPNVEALFRTAVGADSLIETQVLMIEYPILRSQDCRLEIGYPILSQITCLWIEYPTQR
uniref:Integrase catalytic domain-containing protein n=1 Tax=Acrobeloides nanus TaxID=290746 RepID=A0A914ES37_9BILA